MTKDQRASHREVWAVVPVKHTAQAKQRPAKLLSLDLRQELALAMLEDVLQALGVAPHLAGIVIVTVDAQARKLASRCGAETWTCGAEDGHTGAVTAAARRLAANHAIMLTIPGDVPLVSAADIARLVAARSAEPAFTIVPARDERGSNAILCSPADRVPLRFGNDSFFPHLAAARRCGVEPTIVRSDAIALDIDEPADLARFMQRPSATRAWALLDQHRAAWKEAS